MKAKSIFDVFSCFNHYEFPCIFFLSVVAPNASKLAKQYFGCLDIAILNENDRSYEPWEIGSGTEDSHSSTLSTSIGTTQAPFQTSHGITSPHSTTVSFCWAVGVYAKVPGLKEWCYINCMRGYCPRSHCQCVSKTTTSLSPSTSKLLTTPLPTTLKLVCHGTGLYAVVNGMNQWCQMNCLRGYCPKSHCKCTSGAQTPTTTPVALSLKTTKQIKIVCRAIGIQAIVPGMHRWCRINCKRGYCPVSHCKCSSSAEPTRPHQPPYITTPKFFTTKQVNPTTASTTSTLRSLTNTTITQSSAPTTVSINYSTAPPLRHKTKQMPLFLSLSKREAPLFSTFDELPATISWREENTSAKTDGSSPLVPISLYSASSSSTISLPTTSVTKETGRSSSDSTVTAESSPASTVTGGSVTTSAVTIKSDPATTMTSKTVSASTVTSKTSMASAVTNKSETIPTSKVISTTAQMTTRTLKTCTATDIFAGVVGMDHWCNINCNNGYCPKYQCKCDTLVATTVSTCRAIYPYDQMPNMHKWCKTNCAIGYCPSTHCQC